jgi:radical SAM protein with 4Fe4S-binding SPASM domain
MNPLHFLNPGKFVIQWHITDKCNWKCKHCYQGGHRVADLPLSDLKFISRQCLAFFNALGIKQKDATINIGGGEPFLRRDLYKLLTFLNRYKELFKVHIMTNGSLIDKETVKVLKKIQVVRSVQVSLEGLRGSNDEIRARGAFDKTLSSIILLRQNKIHTRVSLTLTKKNFSEIGRMAVYLKAIGVNSFGIRRYVPLGRGRQLQEDMLTPLEMKEFYSKREELKKKLDEKEKYILTDGCEDGIFGSRLKGYHNCGVTSGRHLNVFNNGDVLACRRFPKVVGNTLQNDLLNIHFTSNRLIGYRDLDNVHALCRKCSFFRRCLGGAKCVTSAYFGTTLAPDPQCWRVFKELPTPDLFS